MLRLMISSPLTNITADTYAKTDELVSKWYGFRFSLSSTEQQFLKWRTDTNLPYLRLGMFMFLLTWLICPVLVYFWDLLQFQRMLPLSLGVLVPLHVLGLAASFHPRVKP